MYRYLQKRPILKVTVGDLYRYLQSAGFSGRRRQPKNGQLQAGRQISRFAQTIVGQNITKVTGTRETWLLS